MPNVIPLTKDERKTSQARSNELLRGRQTASIPDDKVATIIDRYEATIQALEAKLATARMCSDPHPICPLVGDNIS